MNEGVKKANEFTKEHAGTINPRFRLNYHLMAPVGWINDPNGLTYFNGEYHAFYQHHPYDREWGPMHWGHAKSKDMVHWEHLPVALAPGDECDAGGCYSGSAVDNDGELTLIYTGHLFNDPNCRDPFSPEFHQNQNIAVSQDGIVFEKYAQNPVIAAPPEDNTQNFRDPKVWQHEGKWYMVVGSTSKDDIGRTILYRSDDLRKWDYLGVLATSKGELGSMWECPDFFELDGKAVQLFSPVGMTAAGDLYHNVFQTGSIIGEFDYDTLAFKHGEFVEMDRGHDFYAVQTLEAPDGRRIGFGWMNMWQTPMPEQEDGWAGAFTLPRELHVTKEGKLQMTPVKELESLRQEKFIQTDFTNVDRLNIGDTNSAEFLIEFDLQEGTPAKTGFQLDLGDGANARFYYDHEAHKLVLARPGEDGERRCTFTATQTLKLHVFIDKSSIEVFVNSGEESFTSRIYPTQVPKVTLFAEGGLVSGHVTGYSLAKVVE